MPTYHRVDPPFRNRDQELAQAFREAVAQAHEHGTHVEWLGKPLHPRVEDDDYNCSNPWCQRMWAMVREAEDRARASTEATERPDPKISDALWRAAESGDLEAFAQVVAWTDARPSWGGPDGGPDATMQVQSLSALARRALTGATSPSPATADRGPER